jgi:PIN domain nuclease of toxin-antitoxin system
MRLLLDTHVLVWWLKDNPKLGSRPRALIAQGTVEVLFSAVSCWEASIKHRSGKFGLAGSELWEMAVDAGFVFTGIEPSHVREFERLPTIARHGDPFDHLLIAQAIAEDAALMTADRKMAEYNVRCIGVK